jgi:acyl dehydratase
MAPKNLTVGEELPVFTRKTGFANWNRYAAVNDEFVPIHMDDEAGKTAGNAGAFGMGNLQWSYLMAMLTGWLDGNGRVVKLACQFRSPNLKGQVVTAKGKVIAIREVGDETLVDLEVSTTANGDTQLAPGTATVAFKR